MSDKRRDTFPSALSKRRDERVRTGENGTKGHHARVTMQSRNCFSRRDGNEYEIQSNGVHERIQRTEERCIYDARTHLSALTFKMCARFPDIYFAAPLSVTTLSRFEQTLMLRSRE